jgi:hypothetical protein
MCDGSNKGGGLQLGSWVLILYIYADGIQLLLGIKLMDTEISTFEAHGQQPSAQSRFRSSAPLAVGEVARNFPSRSHGVHHSR